MSEQHEVTMMAQGDFERIGDGWDGHVAGRCPVQGEGTCDGKPWYFRARGDHWEMYIAERHGADPLDVGSAEAGWYVQDKWGSWPEAGYMPNGVAWGFIEKVIADLRAGELRLVEAREAHGAPEERP